MGKGAKLPTPEASLSPRSVTEYRDSVLTTSDHNVFTEMLKRKEKFAKGQVAPTLLPQSALHSGFDFANSRIASPTEFRPKIQEAYNNNSGRGPGATLPTQAQLFPQRRKSSLPGSANLMAGRPYELVSGFGKKGIDSSHQWRKINNLLA